MRNFGLMIILVAFAAAIFWAISFGTLPPADFTFSNLSEIKSVDPAIVSGQPEGRIIRALYEGLCRWNAKTCLPEPGVAERWEISEDGREYVFHLREEARWSDGSPVTAEDFHWSFRRFLHPATAAEYAYEMWYIEGAEAYTKMRLAEGDPVEIELDAPSPSGRPHGRGPMVRGRLVRIEGASRESENDSAAEEKTYVVSVDGEERRFRKGGGPEASDYRWLLRDFQSVGITALDKRTLRIRLKHPVPYFLNLLGFYTMYPVNRRCVETYGYPAWTRPENLVSNGPYLLKFRRVRDRIRLVKNPQYWDRENVRLEVIDALAVESYQTNLNMYMTGQVDWIPAVPVEVIPELKKNWKTDYSPEPFLSSYYYIVNITRPPLGDPAVRRALHMAIDKQQIVEKVTRAGQTASRSIVPAAIKEHGVYTPAKTDPYDPEKAREILAEAGFSGGDGFPKIIILYNTAESHKAIAEVIQHQWKQNLGIDVSLQNKEWQSYIDSRRQGDFYIARAGWIGDYADPITFLQLFETGNPSNHTRWSNEQYDQLLEAARNEPDEKKRAEILHRAEAILMEKLPVFPIYNYVDPNMVRPYVKGWHRNLLDTHPLNDIWIDQELKREILGR
jgi:oligopeptide transport system substrate-binding protein